MRDLKTFCYTASQRVMTGLAQELKVRPHLHYKPMGYNASRILSLRLVGLNPHYLKPIKAMQAELTLWAGLTDEYQVRIGHDSHSVIIEIPKPKVFWKQVTIEHLTERHYIRRGLVATIGLGLQDEPKRVNFQEAHIAHVLIGGQTRSGKTNTQRLFAWNLAHHTTPMECKLLIFDVVKRGHSWHDFTQLVHLAHPVITDIETADRVLAWLSLEFERRATTGYTSPRLFVFIDELKALLDDSPVATSYLSRLASQGGEFGLHLVLATQYPQIKMLGSAELKRNLTTRLCGRVDSADAAANALGVPDSGAETLGGFGDFLLKDDAGLSRLTVAHLQPKHVELLEHGPVPMLDLPDTPDIYTGPPPGRQPDDLEPAQVGLALFEPKLSINHLQRALAIGGNKATRVKRYADEIRKWAIEHGYRCIEEEIV
jgi:DNA segregation ATPase FtsK/SpoIIIE, S-DNA-T family